MAAVHQTFLALCKHSVQLSTCSVPSRQTCWLVFGSVTLLSDTFDSPSYGVGGVAIGRFQIETPSTGPRKAKLGCNDALKTLMEEGGLGGGWLWRRVVLEEDALSVR